MPVLGAIRDARFREWVGVHGLVAAFALILHLPALGGGFVWLDHAHLQEGLALARPGDLASLFDRGFAGTGFYRPLVALSLSVDAWLGGSPLLFHATTLAWHVAASVMVVVAAKALGLSRESRLASGLLFAVHPVTSLVASAIAFRSEAMAAVALLSLVTFHTRGRAGAAGAALFIGTLCKETALALAPLFIAALELGARARGGAVEPNRRRVLRAEILALAAALALRFIFAPSWRATFPPFSGSEALGTRLSALAKSATAIVPVGLWDRTVCDAFPVASVTSPWALAGATVLLGTIWLARRRGGPAVLFALSLLPSLHLVPIMRWWSPHYLYVPLAFAAMLAAEAIAGTLRRPVTWTACAAVTLGALTFRDDLRFESDDRLWVREVTLNPECREGQFYLAEAHREREQWDDAAARYELAIRDEPATLSFVDKKSAHANLGVVRLQQKRPAEAVTAFRDAIALSTAELDRRRFTCNLAAALLLSGDPDGAARALDAETARPDALPESLLLRAHAFHQVGREDDATALRHRLASTHGRGDPR